MPLPSVEMHSTALIDIRLTEAARYFIKLPLLMNTLSKFNALCITPVLSILLTFSGTMEGLLSS